MPRTNFVSHSQCTICGAHYRLEDVQYTCPRCGDAGTLDIVYDFDALRGAITPQSLADSMRASHWEHTMWRYRPLLPIVDDNAVPPLPVGWTPLISAPRLAESVGVKTLWIKDDGRNPTASLKDRASAMVVARANELDSPVVSAASTGNAAAALAGVCASAGKRAVIFVPASAPEAKVAQMLVFGATVLLVEGTYDEAFDLCLQISQEYGWYCRNTGMNPFTTEGKKTAALEVAEQLGWQAPDVLVVGVGDGSIIGGQHKGFSDLHALGWIDRIPRLLGVQADGSSSLFRAWKAGEDGVHMQPGPAETVADSISASLPRDRVKALRAVRETGGAFVSVSDEAILAAIPDLARHIGVFAEPAAAATLAGLRKARQEGIIRAEDRVVLLVTGSGLKDVRSALRSLGGASSTQHVEATLPAIRNVVERMGLALSK